MTQLFIGNDEVNLSQGITESQPQNLLFELVFSEALESSSLSDGIKIDGPSGNIEITHQLSNGDKNVRIRNKGSLTTNTEYTLLITSNLLSVTGQSSKEYRFSFNTRTGRFTITSINLDGRDFQGSIPLTESALEPNININFSAAVNPNTVDGNLKLIGRRPREINYTVDGNELSFVPASPLTPWEEYQIVIEDGLKGENEESFDKEEYTFYTGIDSTMKFPLISDEALLDKVQEQTFRYFWDFGHPVSGLARERNTSGNTVTSGGSGFGIMAMIVAVERGFISRTEAIDRWTKIVDFLAEADRFHGVWSHWINGNNGEVVRFSEFDDGGDLVETAFMIQGLLTVRQYLDSGDSRERSLIAKINTLWEEVEWDWYTKGGENVLYWHWSPEHEWRINLPISGYNESLIIYVLAAASPTHAIDSMAYHGGWARNGNMQNGNSYYGHTLPLGNQLGGPLFFAHYSFLGLDPRKLTDRYADYWQQNVNHTLINRAYCIDNPKGYAGYSAGCWGLTASDGNEGYSAHSPTNDRGVITPTAALSSMPYTPEESMEAMKHFYYYLGDRLWGDYGFYDAFNPTEGWVASSYLAIDQGPIICMIENHRSGLLWELFMSAPEVKVGLDRLGFNY